MLRKKERKKNEKAHMKNTVSILRGEKNDKKPPPHTHTNQQKPKPMNQPKKQMNKKPNKTNTHTHKSPNTNVFFQVRFCCSVSQLYNSMKNGVA